MIGYETILPGEAFYYFALQHVDADLQPIRKDPVGILFADIANDKRFVKNRRQAVFQVPPDKHAWEEALGQVVSEVTGRDTFNQAWQEAEDYFLEVVRGDSTNTKGSLIKQSLDDYGNGQRLIERFCRAMKYATDTMCWYFWDGIRWSKDVGSLVARFMVHKTMLEFLEQAKELPMSTDPGGSMKTNPVMKWAMKSFSTGSVKNTLVEAAPYVRITSDQFDRDAWKLNVLNGTIDLRNQKFTAEHNREDLMTKLAPVNYDPQATAERWERFLDETFDPTTVPFVKRASGYSLTGVTREKCMFILYRATNRGKTTFLETLLGMLGDYGMRISCETLIAKTRDSAQQEDIADLQGARLVVTSETEEGQRLSESIVKRHTQGQGKLKACRKYEHTVQFPETHKTWLDSNHLPMIYGTDDAIWGRLMPIPVSNAEIVKDKKLPQALLCELSRILNWCLAGLERWLEMDELGETEKVVALRREYRSHCDLIGLFFQKTCEKSLEGETTADLYTAFSMWAKENGEHTMTVRVFERYLGERRDVTAERIGSERHRAWQGYRFNSDWRARVDLEESDRRTSKRPSPPRSYDDR